MASIFALGWFWISVLLFFKSPPHQRQQQKLRQTSMPHAYPEQSVPVTELISIPPATAAPARVWSLPPNLTLPPLCRNGAWDPQACRHWKPALVNLEKRRRKAAMEVPFQLSHAPPAVCGHGRDPIRLELRGSHFRSWWGHVMPKIMQSARQNCSLACEVRWSAALHRPGDAAPFAYPTAADLVIDSLHPGPAVEYPTKLALVALEASGGGGGSIPHNWASLQRVDMLISWSRNSEVPINYMYAWTGLCGTGSALSGGLERCMQPAPSLSDLAGKKFAAVFVSNCGGSANHRLRFLRAVIQALPPGSVDSWGQCLHTAGLPTEVSLLRKHRSKLRARALKVGDNHRGLRKLAILLDYKFTFAFENSIRHDYVTEKTYHGILAASLPVVWGAPEVADFMPGGPGSFINALDFASPQALANHLLMLDHNQTAYLEYFEWRQRRPSLEFLYLQSQSFTNLGEDSWPCRACLQFREQFCT